MENSIWMDEVYSLVISQHSLSRLIDYCISDAHPPLYYLALKSWLKAGRLMGFEPGILWARSMNLVPWLALAAMAWFGGRRLLGRHTGTLMAWCVCGSTTLAYFARDLRSYAFVLPALFICYMLLFLLEHLSVKRRWMIGGWILYAFCASVALWSHWLSAIVLTLLGLYWIYRIRSRERCPAGYFRGGALAQITAIAGFGYWFYFLADQFEYLHKVSTLWMTPPTIANWFWVYLYWLPLGNLASPKWDWSIWLVGLGMLSATLPMALSIMWRRQKNSTDTEMELVRRFTVTALTMTGAYVTILWGLNRLGIAQIFHGPRYPMLTIGLWSAGLAGLSSWVCLKARRHPRRAWMVASPWLACCLVGEVLALRNESRGGLERFLSKNAEWYHQSAGPVYLTPPELYPFFHRTLSGMDIRRIEELATVSEQARHATLLNLNVWDTLQWPRDRLVRKALEEGVFSETFLEQHSSDYKAWRLITIRHAEIARLFVHGFTAVPETIPGHAVASAFPEMQLERHGWSRLETTTHYTFFRWGTRNTSQLRFNSPIEKGEYNLYLRGFRSNHPADSVEMTLQFEAENERVRWNQSPGSMMLKIPIRLRHRHAKPKLIITHPVWSPRDAGESDDARTLSFLFQYSWMEPRHKEQ